MRLLLLYTLLLFTTTAYAEAPPVSKLRYKITKDGKEIGYIKAERITEGENLIYEVETKMTIKVVLNQNVNYTSRAVYRGSTLQSSLSKSYVNGKLYQTCKTVFQDGRYLIKNNNNDAVIARNISYSGVMLYFQEPGNATLVYSEMSGYDNKVKNAGNGNYILINSKSGKQNHYWYKSGILDRATIDHLLADLEIQRVN